MNMHDLKVTVSVLLDFLKSQTNNYEYLVYLMII